MNGWDSSGFDASGRLRFGVLKNFELSNCGATFLCGVADCRGGCGEMKLLKRP